MQINSPLGHLRAVVSSFLALVGRWHHPCQEQMIAATVVFVALVTGPMGMIASVDGQDAVEEGAAIVGDAPSEEFPTRLQTFVTEREFDRVFDGIQKSIQRKDWVPIAEVLLQLQLEDSGLLTRYQGSTASVSVAATQVLMQLPEEGQAVYRRLAEPVAAEKLRQAIADSDVDALREVARCYRLTAASERALQLLTARLIDLGEWEEATLLSERPGSPVSPHRVLSDLNRTHRRLKSSEQLPAESLKFVSQTFPSRIAEWESPIEMNPVVREILDSTYRELRESGLGPYPSMSLADADGVIVACGPSQWTGLNPETGEQLWMREIPGYMSNWMRSPGDLSNVTRRRLFAISVALRVFDETLTSRTTASGTFLYLVEMISLEDPVLKIGENSNPPPPASRIICVDSRTGEQVWSFDGHPAAEIYFSGPPAIFGDRLYALGESTSTGSMKLFTLEASTGKLLHSLEMASSLSSLNREELRSGLAARIEIHEGQLICATGDGLLLSIDPLFGEITWAVRMPRTVADDLELQQDWNQFRSTGFEAWGGWQEVQLLHSAGHLIYVTPESNQIFILDHRTGRLVRQIPREQAVHLLVTQSPPSLVLIAKRSMRSVDLETGTTRWESIIPQPAGRGSLIGETYLFPVFESDIARVHLPTGRVECSFQFQLTPLESDGVLPYRLNPRQLVTLAGGVYELSLQGVRKLQSPQQAAHLARFRSRHDEIINHVERGEGSSLIAELQELIKASPESESKEVASLRRLLRSLLLDQSRAKVPTERTTELEESIRSVSPLPLERAHWRQVRARLALQQSNWEEFLSLWLQTPMEELNVFLPSDQEDLRTRLDRWFQAEAEHYLSSQPIESVNGLSRQLNDRLPPVSELSKEEAERLQTCVGLVSAARPWRVQFSADEQREKLARQKLDWLLLSQDTDPVVSAGAISHLISAAFHSRRWADAQRWLQSLESLPDDVVLPNGKTVAVEVRDWTERLGEACQRDSYCRSWPHKSEPRVELKSGSSREVLLHPVPVQTTRGSFFDTLNVEMDFPGYLALRWNGAGWGRPWYQKLPPAPKNLRRQPELTLFWGFEDIGVLQCGSEVFGIAPLNTTGGRSSQILWPPKKEFINTIGQRDNLLMSFKPVIQKQRPGFETPEVQLFDEFLHPLTSVGPVRPGYFCILQQGMLVAMETATGREIWRRYDLPERPVVVGNDEMVGVIAPTSRVITLYRAVDGRFLRRDERKHPIQEILHVDGMMLTMAHGDPFITENQSESEDEESDSEPKSKESVPSEPVVLQRHDLANNSVMWKREWRAGTIPFEIDQRWMGLLSPDGVMEFIDLRTGETVREHRLNRSGPVMKISCSVARDDFLVVISNDEMKEILTDGQYNFATFRSPTVRGTGYCFSRDTGELLWEREGLEGAFRLDQPKDLPVFALLTYEVREEPVPTEATPETPAPPAEPAPDSESGDEKPADKVDDSVDGDEDEAEPDVDSGDSSPQLILRCYDRRTGELLQELKGDRAPFAFVGDLLNQRVTLFTINSRVEIDFSPSDKESAAKP